MGLKDLKRDLSWQNVWLLVTEKWTSSTPTTRCHDHHCHCSPPHPAGRTVVIVHGAERFEERLELVKCLLMTEKWTSPTPTTRCHNYHCHCTHHPAGLALVRKMKDLKSDLSLGERSQNCWVVNEASHCPCPGLCSNLSLHVTHPLSPHKTKGRFKVACLEYLIAQVTTEFEERLE